MQGLGIDQTPPHASLYLGPQLPVKGPSIDLSGVARAGACLAEDEYGPANWGLQWGEISRTSAIKMISNDVYHQFLHMRCG